MEKTHSKTKFMRHPLECTLTFFIFLILSSFLVIANPNWNNWGNQGVRYSDYWARGTSFGSNYPQGNTNFTHIVLTDSNNYSPLVFDINYDGQNEFLNIFSTSIRAYDNNGVLLSNYVTNGTLCGNANIVNLNKDNYNQMVFMTSVSGGYNVNILEMKTTELNLIKSIFVPTGATSYCDLFGGVDWNTRDLWTVYTNNNVTSINIDNGSIVQYSPSPPINDLITNINIPLAGEPFYRGGICSSKYNSVDYIYYPASLATNFFRIVRFNTETKTFINVTTALYNTLGGKVILQCGIVGNPNSAPKVFISHSGNYDGGGGYDIRNNIYNYDLTAFYTNSYLASSTADFFRRTIFQIADINKDGLNEYCFRNSLTTYSCYNYNNVKIVGTNTSVSETIIYGMIALGQYDSTTPYMQIISGSGIYNLVDNENLSNNKIYNFSSIGAMVMPVALQNKASFKKDIILVNALSIDYYIGSGVAAVCGNDICEYSETQFNCAEDCFNSNNSAAYGTVQNGNQCLNDSWCVSGTCDITKRCIGRSQGVQCSLSAQCQSGTCDNNGLCSQIYVTDTARSFLELLGLGNVAGLMLVGLIIVFACLMIGARWAGFAGGFFGGAIGVLLSVLVFSLISLWFLFFFFMLLMVMGVLIFIFGRKSD
jgi:hypothetical protein